MASIPLLEELLGTWPELRVNIDCKSDRAIAALASAIRRTASIDRVLVGAFNDSRVARLRRELGPGLCTALGPAGVAGLRLLRMARTSAMAAQVPARAGRLVVTNTGFIERAHAARLQVHVWTIDDSAEMHRLLDLGVDGLMTDKPMILRDVLLARGQWHS
jgi:glycerophosphoryl diester phosphodiesterase